MSPEVGSNSSSLWNGSHGGPEKSSNAARLKNTFLEKLNEKYKNHGNKTTTQGRHMLEQSRCIICDHSRLSPGRHSCVFKKVCVLLGVWSPNNAALTSKGPMFPSILEVRGEQAGKEARTKKNSTSATKEIICFIVQDFQIYKVCRCVYNWVFMDLFTAGGQRKVLLCSFTVVLWS